MAKTTGATAVAERPADALWLAALPTPRIPAAQDSRPARGHAAEGVLEGLPGAATDMTVSRDGRLLVAAHYGADTVSLIDTATLTVRAAVRIPEPSAPAHADRVYVTCAGIAEDGVVAVDVAGGVALAAKDIDGAARGLTVSPNGATLYVARLGAVGADVAVIDVESGRTTTVPVPGATIDVLRLSADGSTLFAVLGTAAGSALAIIDTRRRKVLRTVELLESISDLAVHRDGRRVLVTGWDSQLGGVLTVIDISGRVLDTVAVGAPATQVVVTDAHAYVVHDAGIAVFAVGNAEIVEEITVDRPVACVAVNPAGTRLYIADFDGTVTSRSIAANPRLRAAS